MDIKVRPLTPELWPSLADLFGEGGAASRCWCMYWRIGAEYRRLPSDQNRDSFRQIVEEGPPPGLLALTGDTAVGWCQITPRQAVPMLDRNWRLKRMDDVPVWSITCLYVRKGYRKRGVTAALIAEAVALARQSGAPAVEAYPLDAALSTSSSDTGFASTFEQAGFTTIARHVPPRPIMRYDLTGD